MRSRSMGTSSRGAAAEVAWRLVVCRKGCLACLEMPARAWACSNWPPHRSSRTRFIEPADSLYPRVSEFRALKGERRRRGRIVACFGRWDPSTGKKFCATRLRLESGELGCGAAGISDGPLCVSPGPALNWGASPVGNRPFDINSTSHCAPQFSLLRPLINYSYW